MLHIPRLPGIRWRGWYWLYQKASLALLVVSLFIFLLTGGLVVGTYFTTEIIILVDIIQLSLVTLIRYVRKEGLQAISLHTIWRSIRFRITLWYTIILAIVLLIFSSLVTHTTLDSQVRAIDDTLHSHLIQISSTYNPQTQQLTLPAEPGPASADSISIQSKTFQVTSTSQAQNKTFQVTSAPTSPTKHITRVVPGTPEQDIYILLTPSGQILQASPGIDQNSNDMARFLRLESQYALRTQPEPGHTFSQDTSASSTNAASSSINRSSPRTTPSYLGDNISYIATIKDTQLQLYDINFTTFYTFGKDDYRIQTAAVADQQGKVQALVIAGQYTSTSMAWQATLTQVQDYAIPLTVLLASIGGFWLADNAMRPVQKITSSVRQITATDLHKRLHMKQKDELGDLAATFDEMLDRLEGAFERQRQFTADASHELRTPLAIIDLETTRALGRDYTTQQYWQAMKIIQQENQHMAYLVNDLLMLARADSGQYNLQREEVDLGELTLDTVERLAPLAQQTGITIQMEPSSELLMQGDYGVLGRMISNIIENALKYSVGSGTHVDINLMIHHIQGRPWARLSIADNGPGIAEEHLFHIFERFYRVDAARTHTTNRQKDAHSTSDTRGATTPKQTSVKPGGSGLGLSIARWIAHAHGGEIDVQSQPGHGTTFEIWLPLTMQDQKRQPGLPEQSTTPM